MFLEKEEEEEERKKGYWATQLFLLLNLTHAFWANTSHTPSL